MSVRFGPLFFARLRACFLSCSKWVLAPVCRALKPAVASSVRFAAANAFPLVLCCGFFAVFLLFLFLFSFFCSVLIGGLFASFFALAVLYNITTAMLFPGSSAFFRRQLELQFCSAAISPFKTHIGVLERLLSFLLYQAYLRETSEWGSERHDACERTATQRLRPSEFHDEASPPASAHLPEVPRARPFVFPRWPAVTSLPPSPASFLSSSAPTRPSSSLPQDPRGACEASASRLRLLAPFPPPLLLAPERSPSLSAGGSRAVPWLPTSAAALPEELVTDLTVAEVRESCLALSSLLRTMECARRKIRENDSASSPAAGSPGRSLAASDAERAESAREPLSKKSPGDSFEDIELSVAPADLWDGAPPPSAALGPQRLGADAAEESPAPEGAEREDAEAEKRPGVQLGWESEDTPRLASHQRGELTWQQEDVFYHGSQLLFHLMHLSVVVKPRASSSSSEKSRISLSHYSTESIAWPFLALLGLIKASPECSRHPTETWSPLRATPSSLDGDSLPGGLSDSTPDAVLRDPSLCASSLAPSPSPLPPPPLSASASQLALAGVACAGGDIESGRRPWGGRASRVEWPLFHCAAALFHLRQLLLFLSPHLPARSADARVRRRRSSADCAASDLGILDVPPLASLPRSLLRLLIPPPLSSFLLLAGELEETQGGTELWIPVSEAQALRLLLSAVLLPFALAKGTVCRWFTRGRGGARARHLLPDAGLEASRRLEAHGKTEEARALESRCEQKGGTRRGRDAALADLLKADASIAAPGTIGYGRRRLESSDVLQASLSLSADVSSSPSCAFPAKSSRWARRLGGRLGAWLDPERRLYLHAVFFPAPNTHWLLPSTAFASPPAFRSFSPCTPAAAQPFRACENACSRRLYTEANCLLPFVPVAASAGACACCRAPLELPHDADKPKSRLPSLSNSPRARLTYRLFLLYTQLQRQEQVEVYVHSGSDEETGGTAASRNLRSVGRGESRTLQRRERSGDSGDFAWTCSEEMPGQGVDRLALEEQPPRRRLNSRMGVSIAVTGAVFWALGAGAWAGLARLLSLRRLASVFCCGACRRRQTSSSEARELQRRPKDVCGEARSKRSLSRRGNKRAARFIFRCACTDVDHQASCLGLAEQGGNLGVELGLAGENSLDRRVRKDRAFLRDDAAVPDVGGNVLIFFNPNAGYLETAAVIGDGELNFYRSRGVSVLLFNYRGFGRSAGKSSPASLLSDAAAVYRFVASWPGVRTVGVHGRSIGGMPAIFLALRQRYIRRRLLASDLPLALSPDSDSSPCLREALGVPRISFLCADRTFSSLPDAAGGLLGSWAYWGVRGAALTAHVGFSLSRFFLGARRRQMAVREKESQRQGDGNSRGDPLAEPSRFVKVSRHAGEARSEETDAELEAGSLDEDAREAARSCRLGARSVHAFLACTNVHKVLIADPQDEVVRDAASLKAGVARALLTRRRETTRRALVHALMAERLKVRTSFAGGFEDRTDSDPSLPSAPLLGEAAEKEGMCVQLAGGEKPGGARRLQTACSDARRHARGAGVSGPRGDSSSSSEEETHALCRRRATRAVRSLHRLLSSSSLPTAITARSPPSSVVRASASFAASRTAHETWPLSWRGEREFSPRRSRAEDWGVDMHAGPAAETPESEKVLRSRCEEDAAALLHERERKRKRLLRRVPGAWRLLDEVVNCVRLLSLSASEGGSHSPRLPSEDGDADVLLSFSASEASDAASSCEDEEGSTSTTESREKGMRRSRRSLHLRHEGRRTLSRRKASRLERHAEHFPALREALRTCVRRVNARLRESDTSPFSSNFSSKDDLAACSASVEATPRGACGGDVAHKPSGVCTARPCTRRSNATVYTAVGGCSDEESEEGLEDAQEEEDEVSGVPERRPSLLCFPQRQDSRQVPRLLQRPLPRVQLSLHVLGLQHDADGPAVSPTVPGNLAQAPSAEMEMPLSSPCASFPATPGGNSCPSSEVTRHPLHLRDASDPSSFSELSVPVKADAPRRGSHTEAPTDRVSPREPARLNSISRSGASLKLVFLSQQTTQVPPQTLGREPLVEVVTEAHLTACFFPHVAALLAALGSVLATGVDAGGMSLGAVLSQAAEKTGKRDHPGLTQFADILRVWGAQRPAPVSEKEEETRVQKLFSTLREELRKDARKTEQSCDGGSGESQGGEAGAWNRCVSRESPGERRERDETNRTFASLALSFRREIAVLSGLAANLSTCTHSHTPEKLHSSVGDSSRFFVPQAATLPSSRFSSRSHSSSQLSPRLSPVSPRVSLSVGDGGSARDPFPSAVDLHGVFAAAEAEAESWERERLSGVRQERGVLFALLGIFVTEGEDLLLCREVQEDLLTLLHMKGSLIERELREQGGVLSPEKSGTREEAFVSEERAAVSRSASACVVADLSRQLTECVQTLRSSSRRSIELTERRREGDTQTEAETARKRGGDCGLEVDEALDENRERGVSRAAQRKIVQLLRDVLQAEGDKQELFSALSQREARAARGSHRKRGQNLPPSSLLLPLACELGFSSVRRMLRCIQQTAERQTARDEAELLEGRNARRWGLEHSHGDERDTSRGARDADHAGDERLPSLPSTRALSEPLDAEREDKGEEVHERLTHIVGISHWADCLAAFMRLQALVSVYRLRTALRRYAAFFLLLYRKTLYPPPFLSSLSPSRSASLSSSGCSPLSSPRSSSSPRHRSPSSSVFLEEENLCSRFDLGDRGSCRTLRRGTEDGAMEELPLAGSETDTQVPVVPSRASPRESAHEAQRNRLERRVKKRESREKRRKSRDRSETLAEAKLLEDIARSRALWMLQQELLLFVGERMSSLLDFADCLWSAYLEFPVVEGHFSPLLPMESGEESRDPSGDKTAEASGLKSGEKNKQAREMFRTHQLTSEGRPTEAVDSGETKVAKQRCPFCVSPPCSSTFRSAGHLLPSTAGHNGPLSDAEFLLLHLHLLASNFIDPGKFALTF
ncbi:hypothetical protein TGME49_312700 [Toxoplasma gondii ME49]|uniref:Alpha/beta hydrolase family protein n=4 Tax=Toxoplasma gondii TaxID=5811 RepID=A0A0F7VA28_TOXGV|nr:hypothetical protein TGME49_312700 [Toxoplasma gondii ME49]EPT25983.1 hypothetical protein TGME49_312700 [Toxoplasma gondii ME49]CEL77528.1 TPA: hypothetical protein BN1205_096810 [Toxoplasma gondii VEG]|eukprot:XP_018635461.1 hypothetical protein TGME49_312700 [Toxoplasma gondii ME49]